MKGPEQEVKIKAQACLKLSRCLLSALGNSTLVSECIRDHRTLIPDHDVDKLEQLIASNEHYKRISVEMVLTRAITECKAIIEDKPSRYKLVLFGSVEKLIKALVAEKRTVVNYQSPTNSHIEAHFKSSVLLISDIDRIGDKSLKLIRSWFKGAKESESLEIDVDVSNTRSPEYLLFLILSKSNVIGDDFESSPVITYKGKSYKIYKFYDEEMISLKVINLD